MGGTKGRLVMLSFIKTDFLGRVEKDKFDGKLKRKADWIFLPSTMFAFGSHGEDARWRSVWHD